MAEMTAEVHATGLVDPRAVRVALARSMTIVGMAAIVVEPGEPSSGPGTAGMIGSVRVDGAPVSLSLERRNRDHVVLVEGVGSGASRSTVIMLPFVPAAGSGAGVAVREVLVDGWRIELEIESAQRAALRERARIGRGDGVRAGPMEMLATIPGRVLAVQIAEGDAVVAGQALVVVEAMKMQNELRATRDGVVGRVAVGPGETIEVGDLLLVLE